MPTHKNKSINTYITEKNVFTFHFKLLEQKSVKELINQLKLKRSSGYNNIWKILDHKFTYTTHILRTVYNSFIYPIFNMLCFYGNIKQVDHLIYKKEQLES